MIYKVLHTFKDEIFVPLLAISSNVDFLFDKKKRLIVTSDNIQAVVTRFDSLHILSDEARELVKRLYNVDVYSFMRKWHSALDIASMEFVYMNLKKYEEEHREDN
jgi:hypothetical protein